MLANEEFDGLRPGYLLYLCIYHYLETSNVPHFLLNPSKSRHDNNEWVYHLLIIIYWSGLDRQPTDKWTHQEYFSPVFLYVFQKYSTN